MHDTRIIRFGEFISEQSFIRNPQKKDFSVEYGKYNHITKLALNGKMVEYFTLSIPEYSRMPFREFMYSRAHKVYVSHFRNSEIWLSKKVWDSAKKVDHVDFR